MKQQLEQFLARQKELRQAAEKGVLMADTDVWPANDNLQHWVNSNRHDEEHTHGDGVACFLKRSDAVFFEEAGNQYINLIKLIELYRSELHSCIDLMPEIKYVSREELRNAIDAKAMALVGTP